MSTIRYAVIALKRNEVDAIIEQLKQDGLPVTAKWLDERKDELYGNLNEHWKPFHGKTIDQLLESDPHNYVLSNALIEALDDNATNYRTLRGAGIEIYFIDIFAPYLKRYHTLAQRLDLLLAESGKCCFIVPHGLSEDSLKLLEKNSATWPAVSDAYAQGFFHPVAMRAEDLAYLRHYVQSLARDDAPSVALRQQLEQLLGPARSLPQIKPN